MTMPRPEGYPPPGTIPQHVIDGVWEHVDQRESTECWPWLLSIASHGYGQIGWQIEPNKSTKTTAHRVAWMAANGATEIPAGMTVDHICHNRPCCNPAHLRLLSHVENSRDNGYAGKTHCPRGHHYDETNTYYHRTPTGLGRTCRACGAERARRKRASEKVNP